MLNKKFVLLASWKVLLASTRSLEKYIRREHKLEQKPWTTIQNC